jgi:tetratricopeptide (TPR) repeat protein
LIKKAMRLTPYYHAWFLSPLIQAYILTEQYTEATEAGKLMLERSRKGEFDPLEAHLLLASAYAGLGKNDKAGAHAEEVQKINPNFSSGYFLKILPYKNPVHLKSRIALYRKAGLPE